MDGIKRTQAMDVQAHLLRRDLSLMIRKTLHTVDPNAPYSHNWHIDLYADYLKAVHDREIKRLIINVPPRTLKSVAVNVAWSAWLLGQNPSERILSGSVSQKLAKKNSLFTRRVMQSEWYQYTFPETIISTDQNEKMMFSTTMGGERHAVSVGSSVIGEGGNVLIVDDPHDPDGVESEVQRQTAIDWFDNKFSTRTNDPEKAVMVVIMQRLHQLDLTGHLMELGGWHQVVLPAVAEKRTIIDFGRFKNRPIIREEGSILHPARLPPEFLEERKRTLGPYGWAGQFQQRPAPKGGGMLKREWLKHYRSATGEGMNIAILVDPAGSKRRAENRDPDYTAMIVVGLASDRNYYVLDMIRDRLNLLERTEALFRLHKRWTKGRVPPRFVGYERRGMQADIEHIEEEMERRNYRFNITELNDGGSQCSKEQRVGRLVPLFSDSRIWLPNYGFFYSDTEGVPHDLVKAFIEDEYLYFPKAGKHDDMLDALAMIRDPDFNIDFPMDTPNGEPPRDVYDFEGGASKGSFMSV